QQAGRFHPTTAIYAVPRSFSRPILARTYSAEVPSLLSNLPHHRIAPLQGLWYHTSTPPCVSRTFSNFFGKFPVGFAPLFCRHIPSPPGMGERGRQAASFPLAPAAPLCYDTQKRPLLRAHYLFK